MTRDKITIALADDDQDDRELFEEAVMGLKIKAEILPFENGERLMEFLNDLGNRLPDIIFLDLNMPIKDGLQCLAEIRKGTRTADIPVAIYSTSSSEHDIEKTLVLGANIYICKPTSFAKLKEAISKVLCTGWQYITSELSMDNFVLKV